MKVNIENQYKAVSSTGEEAEFRLGDLLGFGNKTLLFFYPRDNTPGCTTESKGFSCLVKDFAKLGITIIGVSKDSLDSHKKFITKHNLTVDLLSDPELILHKELGAWGEKKKFGMMSEGVLRSTFLLDKNGEVLKKWEKVNTKTHAEEVLKELS